MKAAIGRLVLVLDVVGAALFAAALAAAVAGAAQGGLTGTQLLTGTLLLVASGLVRATTLAAPEALATNDARTLLADLRGRLLPHLFAGRLSTPLAPGNAATIALDHGEALRMRAVRFAPVRLAAVVSPLIVLVLTAFASLVAAGILLFTFVFFVLVMILTGNLAAREADAQLGALTTLSGLIEDRLLHLPIIRHFGAEERITRQIGQSSQELSDRTVAVLRKAFLSSAALEFFAALAVALVAVYCGFSLLGLLPFPDPEELTLAEAFFALTLAPEFYLPMRRLAAAYHEKQVGEAADRVIDPLLAEADAPAPQVAPFSGIAVDEVTVRFDERVIGPISFDLGPVGMAVLAGPTGSGKSTMLGVIAGQVEAAGGVVAVPDTSARPDPQDIAWAAQKPLLLPGTLAYNIAIAQPQATPAQIEAVARQVGLGDVIARRGLDLVLDTQGAGLSGGEGRRIGLARAILSRRPLILLDEPTADLDAASAAGITALLADLAHERALVVATHDQQVVALGDTVVRL